MNNKKKEPVLTFPSLILTNKPTRINIHTSCNEVALGGAADGVGGGGSRLCILTVVAPSPALHLIQYSDPK